MTGFGPQASHLVNTADGGPRFSFVEARAIVLALLVSIL
jgi:hypothetical protein